MNKQIFLVGMMGAGKSSAGRILASRLGVDFVDLDSELERRCGARIPVIFATEGEAGFRKREAALLKEYLNLDQGIVVATGGGVVTQEANRQALASSQAQVIYLKVSAEQAYERVKRSDRPLLATGDALSKLQALIKEREPWYEQVCSDALTTDGNSPAQTASALQKLIAKKSS